MPKAPELSQITGEFISFSEEMSFRLPRLAETVRHMRHILWIASAFFLAFALLDYQQLGWCDDFIVRAGARLVVAIIGVGVTASLRWVRAPSQLAWRFAVFVGAIMVGYVAVLTTSPPMLFTHVSMFVTLGLTILLSPSCFRVTLIIASSATLLYLAAVWDIFHPDLYADFGTLALLFTLALVIGALLMRRFNLLMRHEYIADRAEQRAIAALQQSEESMRRLFMAVPVPLLLIRLRDGQLIQANNAGYSVCVGDTYAAAPEATAAALFGEDFPLSGLAVESDATELREVELHGRGGTRKSALLAASRVVMHGEEALIVGITDITERKQLEETLRQWASTDPLTGLFNRRHFLAVAEAEMARAQRHRHPLALLMLDVDRFKEINDSFGHAAGDEVLRLFANSCCTLLRQHDVVCRFGGEEFVLLLPETDAEGAMQIAERLRALAEAADVESNGALFGFTVSIGVAAVSPQDETIDAPLKRADAALYRAKQNGRNRVERYGTMVPIAESKTCDAEETEGRGGN